MKLILLISLSFLAFQCTDPGKDKETTPKGLIEKDPTSEIKWTYKVVPLEEDGWGYQLFRGAHLEINQKNIPAIPGLHFFETKENAELAAKLALEKIDQGMFPPTVSPAELDSVGAINLDSLVRVNEELLK